MANNGWTEFGTWFRDGIIPRRYDPVKHSFLGPIFLDLNRFLEKFTAIDSVPFMKSMIRTVERSYKNISVYPDDEIMNEIDDFQNIYDDVHSVKDNFATMLTASYIHLNKLTDDEPSSVIRGKIKDRIAMMNSQISKASSRHCTTATLFEIDRIEGNFPPSEKECTVTAGDEDVETMKFSNARDWFKNEIIPDSYDCREHSFLFELDADLDYFLSLYEDIDSVKFFESMISHVESAYQEICLCCDCEILSDCEDFGFGYINFHAHTIKDAFINMLAASHLRLNVLSGRNQSRSKMMKKIRNRIVTLNTEAAKATQESAMVVSAEAIKVDEHVSKSQVPATKSKKKKKKKKSSAAMNCQNTNLATTSDLNQNFPTIQESLSNLAADELCTNVKVDDNIVNPKSTPSEAVSSTDMNIKNHTPIFFYAAERSLNILEKINSLTSHKTYGRSYGEAMHLSPDSRSDFNIICELLSSEEIPYHTYLQKEEKPRRFIIKGLMPCLTKEVLQELQSLGYTPTKVVQLEHSDTSEPMPVILVILPRGEKNDSLLKVKKLFSLQIKVEKQRKKKPTIFTVCYKCQGIGHTSYKCFKNDVCVRCGEGHRSSDCKRPVNEPPTCVHCKGAHTANFKGCSYYQKFLQTFNEKRKKKEIAAISVIPDVAASSSTTVLPELSKFIDVIKKLEQLLKQ